MGTDVSVVPEKKLLFSRVYLDRICMGGHYPAETAHHLPVSVKRAEPINYILLYIILNFSLREARICIEISSNTSLS